MLRFTIHHIFYNLKSKEHQQTTKSGLLYIGVDNFKKIIFILKVSLKHLIMPMNGLEI